MIGKFACGAVACLVCSPVLAQVSVTQTTTVTRSTSAPPIVDTVGAWTIGYDSSSGGCYTNSYFPGGQQATIGQYRKGQGVVDGVPVGEVVHKGGYMLLSGAGANEFVVGSEYPVVVSFTSGWTWRGLGKVMGFGDGVQKGLMLMTNDGPLYGHFGTELGMKALVGNVVIMDVGLKDSGAALKATARCQSRVDEQVRSAQAARGRKPSVGELADAIMRKLESGEIPVDVPKPPD